MKEQILKALSKVIDPDLKENLVKLNMIENLRVENKDVYFTIVLTTPACPLKNIFIEECTKIIHEEVDSSLNIHIDFDSKVAYSKRQNSDLLTNVKNMIAVASGKGGVGKSTVAVNLAIMLAELGSKVGLLDADMNGPSIPVMLGIENEQPKITTVNGKTLMLPVEKFGIKIMSIGMLMPQDKPLVWRGPMLSNGLSQMILETLWEETDYLIVDLPPGTGDIHITLCQQMPLTGVVIVTTPQRVSLTDTIKTIEMFRMDKMGIPVLGIIENMSYFIPAELPENKYYIFGQGGGELLAGKYKLPLLARLPLVMGVTQDSDTGIPAISGKNASLIKPEFQKLAGKLVQQIAISTAINS